MKKRIFLLAWLAAIAGSASEVNGAGIENIENIVVIYAENRSFDNLYGFFPGANGLSQITPADYTQRDRDGSVLKELPPVWDGLTAKGVVPAVSQAQTEHPALARHLIRTPTKALPGMPSRQSKPTVRRSNWQRICQNQRSMGRPNLSMTATCRLISMR